MESNGLTLLIVTTAVVAVTELLNRIRTKDYSGVAKIVTAIVAGGLAGAFGLEGLSVLEGVLAGLSAVGIHTTARQIG